MNRLRSRIDKLSADNMQGPVIVLMEDEELTEDQRLQIARAENADLKPHIIKVMRASKCLKTE